MKESALLGGEFREMSVGGGEALFFIRRFQACANTADGSRVERCSRRRETGAEPDWAEIVLHGRPGKTRANSDDGSAASSIPASRQPAIRARARAVGSGEELFPA